MKIYTSFVLLILLFSCNAPTSEKEDVAAIKKVLKIQENAWSNNDLEGFMQGYIKSDSLPYFGGNGITYGWQQMLDSYKRRYPTKEDTGKLIFTIVNISPINKDAYWVMGKYHLTREIGDANGTFMIVFKRINGEWKIVGDHSC